MRRRQALRERAVGLRQRREHDARRFSDQLARGVLVWASAQNATNLATRQKPQLLAKDYHKNRVIVWVIVWVIVGASKNHQPTAGFLSAPTITQTITVTITRFE